MLHTDIERFLGTLLYPLSDVSLLFYDPLNDFLKQLPKDIIKPHDVRDLLEKRKAVYEKSIEYLTNKCQLDTYDQIEQYMERWYLGEHIWRSLQEKQKEPLHLYDLVMYRISQLSTSMISKLDGKFTYKYWETKGDAELLGGFAGHDKIHLFRGLTQLMPLDLLVAVFMMNGEQNENEMWAFHGDVFVTDTPLEQIFQKGVSENHLHMGVSAGFSLIWEELMSPEAYSSSQIALKGLPIYSPGAESSRELYFLVICARCLRMWLAIYSTFCMGDKRGNKNEEIVFKLLEPIPYDDFVDLSKIYNQCNDPESTVDFFRETEHKLVEFIANCEEVSFLKKTEGGYSEGVFLLRILRGIAVNPCGYYTSVIKTLFINYLRMKHGIFQRIVQHKAVGGLDYFQKYYHSVSRMSTTAGRQLCAPKGWQVTKYERLIKVQLSNPHIKKVEFRTSFPNKISEGIKQVRDFLTAYQKILHQDYCAKIGDDYKPLQPLPRVGLVFHFIKSQQEMPDLCDEADNDTMRRYAEVQKHYEKQMNVFLELRDPEKYPGIDHYLVGIDVASLENAIPTWVFSEVYEKARDGKKEPFLLNSGRPYQSLGFTCHAGEDFRHLISGLRRVYETIHFLKFHAGDRIGHGLALGVEVDEWCRNHSNVVLPRIEALENYLWAYRMLSTYPSASNSGELLYLEKRINTLSAEIFRKGDKECVHVSTPVLLQSYERLFDSKDSTETCNHSCEKSENVCVLLNTKIMTSEDVVKTYHCCRFARYMNEVIHYHIPPQEVAIIKTLQEMMQEFVSRAGVVVEVNPSSNIIIGPMDTIRQHPLYSISSYHCDYKDLMVCVNSDDPGVFQTSVSNELGIAYMGMIEQGIGREACLAWVDRLRENGMQSSFIRCAESDEAMLMNLDRLIKSL